MNDVKKILAGVGVTTSLDDSAIAAPHGVACFRCQESFLTIRAPISTLNNVMGFINAHCCFLPSQEATA
jgi:hypothetical protein